VLPELLQGTRQTEIVTVSDVVALPAELRV